MNPATDAVRAELARTANLTIGDIARATRFSRTEVRAALVALGAARSLTQADGPLVEQWTLPR